MEKKEQSQSNGSRGNKRNTSDSRTKIFGANKIELGEDDAFRLIGGVVEKGISDKQQSNTFSPTPPPKLTVLPFPVARHRSHGPHWSSVGIKKGKDDDNDDDEDDDIDGACAIAALAVKRKQKKGLDFSRWKELMPTDDSSESNAVEEHVLRLGKTENRRKDGEKIKAEDKSNISSGPALVDVDAFVPMEMDEQPNVFVDSVADMELDNSNQLLYPGKEKGRDTGTTPVKNSGNGVVRISSDDFADLKSTRAAAVSSSRSNDFGTEQGSTSLESEIDAENHARLQTMSPDEIAQAQAEIMEKMDPALLNLLKKRGQDKLKKQKCSSSVLPTDVDVGNAQKESQSIQDAKGAPQPQLKKDVFHSQSGQDNSDVQRSGQAGGFLWNAWSDRVEAVREIRFSLDGSVISHDFVPKLDSGDISAQNRLNADNVAERDFLRTDGDPGAAGYTIKEALALTRSTFPAHRSFALHLLASVLDKALHNIFKNQVGCALRHDNKVDGSVDWEAVWAYALGPEPELILTLRMSLDDNHNSVVLACLKVIQCTLSCDWNEYFFDTSEKIAIFGKDIFTAPVFRSKPEVDLGFFRGGYWKYNAKPSNILLYGEDIMDDETEGKHTIQDDIFVGGQDFAAGLVRMGILARLRYLLETNPAVALEECIISILIAIARHSPACADAIMKCERLIHTVVHRFTMNKDAEGQLKSVCLLKVLARSDKKNCTEFVENGVFQAMTMHLYLPVSSLEQWLKLGRENCKVSSGLMVEQLRFWKVCIQYGYCLSYFPHIFPALCLWLNPPSFDMVIENNVLSEFASISTEVYLVLESLAVRLPKFYSQDHLECGDDDNETWYWNHVEPMVGSAVKWLVSKSDLHLFKFFERQKGIGGEFAFQDLSVSPLLWVYSSIMLFLTRVLERVTPEDNINLHESGGNLPCFPKFVSKVGLEIIKNGFLSFSEASDTEYGTDASQGSSFIEELCHLRRQIDHETSASSVACLYGLVRVIASIDNLIQLVPRPTYEVYNASREEEVLEDGILKGSLVELRSVMKIFVELVASEWRFVQTIEIFGRGGPAPGVGLGLGASAGGFWSTAVLLAQTDVHLLVQLLEIFQTVSVSDLPTDEEMSFAVQSICSVLGICLIAGPRDKVIVEKALDIMLQGPVLKSLDICTRRFLQSNKKLKSFGWEYEEEDYLFFSKTLASHFKNRWLSDKRKFKAIDRNSNSGNKTFKKGSVSLDTIHEDLDPSNVTSQDHCSTSLAAEWAHQRLPLPMHWFLSPISTICASKQSGCQSSPQILDHVQEPHLLEVAKSGLFFLLGIEAMATFLSAKAPSPVLSVPLFWKLHSLSVILLAGMGVLEEEKSRDVFEALQEYYGQLLDKAWFGRSTEFVLDKNVNLPPGTGKNNDAKLLRFQTEIHDSYSTFIENLVEQFAAISYGDLIYGRQVAVYLHCCVEAPVRLATWKSLSNTRVLELLPPLEKCFAEAEGYLEPVEDNEDILEAYVKSWTSGALDKAATKQSMAFTLVLHHLSSLVFLLHASDKLALRNKIVKSLLRDYTRQQRHERMMLDLIQYSKPSTSHMLEQNGGSSLLQNNIEKRFEILTEACEGNSSLLILVEKLKSSCVKN
ncbi:hypothetical protein Q3G72_021100 [Acer saccharum]|nr:hypothetical protein Q3G72_021100 [Acer saccharum]